MMQGRMDKKTKRTWNEKIDNWFMVYECPKCKKRTKQLMKLEEYPGLTGEQCSWCGEIFMLEFPKDIEIAPKIYLLKSQKHL